MVTKDEKNLNKFYKYINKLESEEKNKGIFGLLELLDEIDITDNLYYATLRTLFLNKKYVPFQTLEKKTKKYFQRPTSLDYKERMNKLVIDSFFKIKLSDITSDKTLDYLADAKSDLLFAEEKINEQLVEKYFEIQSEFKIAETKAQIELKEVNYYLANPDHKDINESVFDFETNVELLFKPDVVHYNLEFGSPELTLLTHCYKKVKKAYQELYVCGSLKPVNKDVEKKQIYLKNLLENPTNIIFSDIVKQYNSLL